MYVLLDTNVWLAALTRDGVCRQMVNDAGGRCRLVITPFIQAEICEKLVSKFKRSPDEAARLIEGIAAATFLFSEEASMEFPALRDPKDRPVLAAAVGSGSRFLVTGDKDLLELKSVGEVEIITVREFAGRLGLSVD